MINLVRRYPDSKPEDITDAFSRGVICGMAVWRGTCHIVKTWSDSDFVDGWRYRCSECMCFIPVDERDLKTGEVISAANYCPNCGRKVVSE